MKKTLFLHIVISAAIVLTAIFGFACGKSSEKDGKLQVVCGLPPIAFLASQVGKDLIGVQCLLPEGRSPHDYSPRPQDVRDASGAKLFFTTGMKFENAVAHPLKSRLTITDVSAGIKRRHFETGHSCNDPGHHHHHSGSDLDPHIWLSAQNAIVIASNICDALCEKDNKNAEVYRKNFAALKERFTQLDTAVKAKLKPFAGREFFVYHPAFGYFADSVNMKQFPIEINGREATAAQLAEVIKKAKAENIRAIFVQPQFNPASARALASYIKGKVMPLDPLAGNLPENLKNIADTIEKGFNEK